MNEANKPSSAANGRNSTPRDKVNYLLEAVNKLSQKHISKVMQSKTLAYTPDATDETPEPAEMEMDVACISLVDHEPLLVMLRDAVVGGIGSHAGGSSSARERIPFDAGALELFDTIAARINAWYIVLPGAREERYIEDRLRDWYVDYANRLRAGKVMASDEKSTLREVEGWVRSIEAMFDPPTTFEVTTVVDDKNTPVPCPVCAEKYAIDPGTRDRITALVIEFRNEGVETLDHAVAMCRFCGETWRGRNGVRELRWLIEQDERVAEAVTRDTVA